MKNFRRSLFVVGFYIFVIVESKEFQEFIKIKSTRNGIINSGNTNSTGQFQTSQRKFRFIGISRQKPKFIPEKLLSAPLLKNPKSRKEGDFELSQKKATKKVHVSQSLPQSILLRQRFLLPFHDNDPQQQIEVLPSLIEKELPFDFSDDQQKFAASETLKKKKFSDESVKVILPSRNSVFKAFKYPDGFQNKPAFCRRCFKFWRSINSSAPNAALLHYCCEAGNNKRGILKSFIKN